MTLIRATHRYAFRAGEWAKLLTTAPTPVIERPHGPDLPGTPTIRECFLVRFPDGQEDFWPVDDPHAGYELVEEETLDDLEANELLDAAIERQTGFHPADPRGDAEEGGDDGAA